MPGIVTLLTDFGISSHYPSVMKAVLLSACPGLDLIDITHGIPGQDIRSAAFILTQVVPYFKTPAIHLVVVDPGVGTEREAIAVSIKNDSFLVGPNNGVFSWLLRDTQYTVKQLPVPTHASMTFHGRDVFAPAAGKLACNPLYFNELLPVSNLVTLPFPGFDNHADGVVSDVLFIDSFGNILLPIDETQAIIPKGVPLNMRIHNRTWEIAHGTYAGVEPGEPCWHYDSSGFLEIALSHGSMAETAGITANDRLFIRIGGL